MVGGKVIKVRRFPTSVVVFMQDGNDFAGIRLRPNNYDIRRGDTLWWHGRHAYWTPKHRRLEDVQIERIGYTWDPFFIQDREVTTANPK